MQGALAPTQPAEGERRRPRQSALPCTGDGLLRRDAKATRIAFNYSIRTEEACVQWVRRFIVFSKLRHPSDMGPHEVAVFLTHLAVDRDVAASTQNQAKSALLFFHRVVLNVALPWLDEIVSAKDRRRLPVDLTSTELRSLLNELSGTTGLVVSMLYGTGMRLMEGLRFRVKDVGIERGEMTVHDGKGSNDRLTVLPQNLVLPLQAQIAKAKALHLRDLTAGAGRVWLSDALAVKYPHAAQSLGWQWVFPSSDFSEDPRTGLRLRHHMNETAIQKSVAVAVKRAGIAKPCSPHIVRRSFATHLSQSGQ